MVMSRSAVTSDLDKIISAVPAYVTNSPIAATAPPAIMTTPANAIATATLPMAAPTPMASRPVANTPRLIEDYNTG